MKNLAVKFLILGIIIVMILSVVTMPIYANVEGESVILKKSKDEYMVYFNDICNDDFQFAISNKSDTSQENLSYTSSAKDKIGEGSLNIAFIDKTNNPESNSQVYIWIKDKENNIVVSGQKIDLKDALDEQKIKLINTTTIANNNTDRIKVNTTQTKTRKEIIGGVDTTVTTGKIVIEGKKGSKYYYALLSANNATSKARELYDLVDKINNYSGNTYGKLKLAKEFYDLYIELTPEKDEWAIAENNEILQPESTVTGDKYIVYIKEVNSDAKEIIDVKLLECIRKEDQGKDQKEEKTQKTVKLPVTYDSIALIVAFGVIIVAIIIVASLRVKQNKKSGKNDEKNI